MNHPRLKSLHASPWLAAAQVVYKDVARGIGASFHHTLALVGLGVLVLGVVALKPDWRQQWEQHAFGWLQSRQTDTDEALEQASFASLMAQNELRAAGEPGPDMPARSEASDRQSDAAATVSPVERATATDPAHLNKQQAAVATWLSRRYRVAPEPVSRIVQEAWQLGQRTKLEPTLILAIMAIESNFNPFAQSKVGAQGLMQVMTQLHDKKYQAFGGTHAAFDPVTNIRVGVQVLKDCLQLAGDIPTALQYYSGAARLPNDQGYANKVLSEQNHLKNVAAGRVVAVMAPVNSTPLPVRAPGASDSVKASASPSQQVAEVPKDVPTSAGSNGSDGPAALAVAEPSAPVALKEEAAPESHAPASDLPASTAAHQEPAAEASEPNPKS
jgi:soluble lytic murein transglycosylase-like protein